MFCLVPPIFSSALFTCVLMISGCVFHYVVASGKRTYVLQPLIEANKNISHFLFNPICQQSRETATQWQAHHSLAALLT